MNPVVESIRTIILNGQLELFLKTQSPEIREQLVPIIDTIKIQFSHLKFMQYCWMRARKMEVGIHTWLICHEIDKAFSNFRNGISSNLIILCSFRHGKSEITTRYLPIHFLAEFPDRNVIVTSHSNKMTAEFSRFGRMLLNSEKFKELYDINISKEVGGVEEWGLESHEGLSQYFGIQSGISGKGGACIITDDYFGGREDAESEIMRDKVFDAYSNNVYTRRDDPSINLITVTPWHPDDLVGRIIRDMENEDKSTPYKIIRLPYKEPDDETVKNIQEALKEETDDALKSEMSGELDKYANGGYLFSKKYSNQWYLDMETKLGGPTGYGTTSLMRCTPRLKGGQRIKTENVHILKPEEFWNLAKGCTFVRGWDLASSIKSIIKSDPDYTCGVKLAVRFRPSSIKNVNIATLYIADVVRGRWEAPSRNKKIIDTAITDGLIIVGAEAFGGYKDAYTELKEILRGVRVVRKMHLRGDKISKTSVLEPIFEAGNVYILDAPWNNGYIKELSEFPSSKHDDQVDATVVSYNMFSQVKTGLEYEEQLVV